MRTCPHCQLSFPDDADFCPRDGTPLPAVATNTIVQLTTGLARRFRIIRQLGAGGMGAVFLAEQIQVGNRPVALKVLLRKFLSEPEFLQRFQSEAASTGRIHHPNIVTIYESGQAEDGTPYIAMEYLEGETLRETIRRRGPLPIGECTDIIQQAARGLGAAHRLGIIHRDLKPDNIFLTHSEDDDLIVKILDFGIAKLRESATHTLTGLVLGTPQYMSFEQASGMRSEELDARSDLYSLAVITYEILTGRVPFYSDTPLGYLRKHVNEEPPPFRAVRAELGAYGELESVVMKALAKDRDKRHGSVRGFAQELAQAAGTVNMLAPPLPATIKVEPVSPITHPPISPASHSAEGWVAASVQTPTPMGPRLEPAEVSPEPSQPMPSVVPRQPPLAPLPRRAKVIRPGRGVRYWAPGLAAIALVVTVLVIRNATEFSPPAPSPAVQGRPGSEQVGTAVTPSTDHANPSPAATSVGKKERAGRPQVAEREVISPSVGTTETAKDTAHVDNGNRLASQRDWDGAISEYHEALYQNPKNPNAHYNLGWALEQKGNLQEALQEYEKASELNPQNPVFRAFYQRLASSVTTKDTAHVDNGNRLASQRDWDGAIAEYREALSLNPKNANARYNLGWALEQKSSLQEALAEYRKALELNPQNPVFRSAYDRLLDKVNH